MSEEQREHPRIDERKRVSITVQTAPDAPMLEDNTFHCWTRDISAGGVKFCVHSRVPVGARLKLQISLAGTTATFQHIGRVMWLQEFGGLTRLQLAGHQDHGDARRPREGHRLE